MAGLLQIVSNERLLEIEKLAQEAERLADSFHSAIASHVKAVWQVNRDYRRETTEEMLNCLRQRKGIYDDDVMSAIQEMGGSEIFAKKSAEIARGAEAWLSDVLIPAEGKPWGLVPTEQPELRKDVEDRLLQKLDGDAMEALSSGIPVDPAKEKEIRREMKEQMDKLIDRKAELIAAAMEDEITDQLQESNFDRALEEFIVDISTYPAAILKGPIPYYKDTLVWDANNQPVIGSTLAYRDERVNPFDVYPSPGATEIDDGDFIERLRLAPADIYAFKGVDGYLDHNIDKVLEDPDMGRNWLFEDADFEKRRHEQDSMWQYHQDDYIDGLHYWGLIQGQDLKEMLDEAQMCGKPLSSFQIPEQIESFKYYESEVILVGDHVIKCVVRDQDPLPRPYYKASWQNNPGAFWGESPIQLMSDIQNLINGCVRALSNNLGVASGPIIALDVTKLPVGQGEVPRPHALEVYQFAGGDGKSGIPFQFFQADSRAKELIEVIRYFSDLANEVTGIPKYVYGDQNVKGAAQTASGLSALMDAAAKGLRNAIRHIDTGVFKKRIRYQYISNMLYSDRDEIKGDLKVVPKGSTAILIKANSQQRRNEFMQIIAANPMFQKVLGTEGMVEMLREQAKGLEMPDTLIPDTDKVISKLKEESENEPPPPEIQLEKMRIEAKQQEMAMKAQENEKDRQLRIAEASVTRDVKMMEMAMDKELTLEKIAAELEKAHAKINFDNDLAKAEMIMKERRGNTANWGIGQ